MFRIKFGALVFRLGRKYSKALKGVKTYAGNTYGELLSEPQYAALTVPDTQANADKVDGSPQPEPATSEEVQRTWTKRPKGTAMPQ